MSTAEKFPRPWRVEEVNTTFIVRDATGVVIGRAEAGPNMTREEARAIAHKMVESAEALSSATEVERERRL